MNTIQPNKSTRSADSSGSPEITSYNDNSGSKLKNVLIILFILIVIILIGIVVAVWFRYTGNINALLKQ
jgi:cytochrome b subunit of formate dehydrogenase